MDNGWCWKKVSDLFCFLSLSHAKAAKAMPSNKRGSKGNPIGTMGNPKLSKSLLTPSKTKSASEQFSQAPSRGSSVSQSFSTNQLSMEAGKTAEDGEGQYTRRDSINGAFGIKSAKKLGSTKVSIEEARERGVLSFTLKSYFCRQFELSVDTLSYLRYSQPLHSLRPFPPTNSSTKRDKGWSQGSQGSQGFYQGSYVPPHVAILGEDVEVQVRVRRAAEILEGLRGLTHLPSPVQNESDINTDYASGLMEHSEVDTDSMVSESVKSDSGAR